MAFWILRNYHRDKVDDVDNASKAKSPKYKAKPVRKCQHDCHHLEIQEMQTLDAQTWNSLLDSNILLIFVDVFVCL